MSSVQTASTSAPSGQSTPATTAYSTAEPLLAPLAGPAGPVDTSGADGGESSKQALQARAVFDAHASNLASYLFNVGYASRQWADVNLAFFGETYPFHRIIIAQSPYLAGMLEIVRPGSTVHLRFDDELINNESVQIALHHLYSPAFHLVNPTNASAVLATAFLLEGMSELADHAFGLLRQSLSASTVLDFVAWVSSPPVRSRGEFGTIGSGPVEEYSWGVEAASSSSSDGGRYGHYTAAMKQDVLAFLGRQLPSQVPPDQLTTTYAALPFPLFKLCVESRDFPMDGMQDRFAFAKKVIAARRKAAAARGTEEVAVLAFKGGDGMEVVVTKKPKKRTALYKIEG